jgi:methyl-accepting chemotaxis protein
MFRLKRLQTKIALWAGVCLSLTAGAIVAYAAVAMLIAAEQSRQADIERGQDYAVALARQYANQLRSELEVPLDAARTLAHVLSGVKDPAVDLDLTRDEVNGILRTILRQNPSFLGVFTGWEPNAFDGLDVGYAGERGHDATGRFMPYWNRGPGGVIDVEPFPEDGEYYLVPKRTRVEAVIDPYIYAVQGTPTLITSLVAPILVDGVFYGIAGVDLDVAAFALAHSRDGDDMLDDVGVAVFSHNGTLVLSSFGADNVGKNIADLSDRGEEFLGYLAQQRLVTLEHGDYFSVIAPITIGQTVTPWAVNVLMPRQRIVALADQQRAQAMTDMWRMVAISVIGMAAALIALWVIAGNLTRPILQAVRAAERLASGDLAVDIAVTANDEIGQMQQAVQNLIARLREVVTGINQTALQVADGSQAMSASAALMSEGAASQAASTQEASAAMEEMAANIRQNADNAGQTETIAAQAAVDAETSGKAVADAVHAMQTIAKKIAVIDDITRQTRMLSLNATIEAARAHEHGRGLRWWPQKCAPWLNAARPPHPRLWR